ncbi:TetR/AcrR family transcriptional regulator [Mariniluteicoccus flavus]
MTPRATPMPPDERRRAIIDAALPMVRERGFDVSTAEVARAAGIAEGTLFRAFPTKAELLREVVRQATDPAPDIDHLERIDRSLPVETRVRLVIEHWEARIADVSVLMAAVHMSQAGRSTQHPDASDIERHRDQVRRLNAAVEALLADDADALRVSPAAAASFIRSAIFAARHPMMGDADPLPTDALVDLLLHGVTTDGDRPC